MRVGAPSNPAAHAWAVPLSQMTGRVAAHQSTPTDRPVEPPQAISGDPGSDAGLFEADKGATHDPVRAQRALILATAP